MPTNKTIYVSYTNATNHYFISQSQQAQLDLQIIMDIYHKLAMACLFIDDLLLHFAMGDFHYVAIHLNMEGYNKLALLMNSLRRSSRRYPDYEIIRTTINSSLEGLLQAVNQYMLLLNTQTQLEQTQKKASILDDMTLLKEYLDRLRSTRNLFPSTTVTAIAAEIKPEYALYIKLHGYPTNGIFDIDKLADCIRTVAP